MALTVNHPLLKEQTVFAHSPSVATTPVAAFARAGYRGKVVKTGTVINGTITAADLAVSVAINGVAVTGGNVAVTSGSVAGAIGTATPTGANAVNEDDVISFTPSGATGTTITGTFFAVIQAG